MEYWGTLETTNWLLVILLIFIFILGCAIQRVQDAVQSFHNHWLDIHENQVLDARRRERGED